MKRTGTRPPTSGQTAFAERLGVFVDPSDTSTSLSRKLSVARGDIEGARMDHYAATVPVRLKKQGVQIGSVIARGSQTDYVLVVRSIDWKRGRLVAGYRRHAGTGSYQSQRFSENGGLEVRANPPDPRKDPDGWVPAGFVKLTPSLTARVEAGEFGDEVRAELIVRDSFLSATRSCYLVERIYKDVQEKIVAARKAKKSAPKQDKT